MCSRMRRRLGGAEAAMISASLRGEGGEMFIIFVFTDLETAGVDTDTNQIRSRAAIDSETSKKDIESIGHKYLQRSIHCWLTEWDRQQ